jgi:hypothetical protein
VYLNQIKCAYCSASQAAQLGDADLGSLITGFDGQEDLERMLELADIIDELKMIRKLQQTQSEVLMSFRRVLIYLKIDLDDYPHTHVKMARRLLEEADKELDVISINAEDTQKMVCLHSQSIAPPKLISHSIFSI